MLAEFIGKQFFPADNYYITLMKVFCIFAVGYLVRPIGGIVFGMIGDRIGRKNTLLTAMLIMGFTVFIMGIMPTYAVLGNIATIIFLLLRIIQGIAHGAQLPGSLTFLAEHVTKEYRSTYCGFMVAGVGLGVTISSFIVYFLLKILAEQNMLLFGWRIPFLLGSVLVIVSYFFRKQLHETPCFMQETNRVKNPISILFNEHLSQIILAFGLIIFPVCFILFLLCIPSYLHKVFDYQLSTVYFVIMLGYIWSTFLIPVFARLADYMGRKWLLFGITFLFTCFGVFFFKMLLYKSVMLLICFMLIYQTIIAVMAACYFVVLIETFPTKARYTGVALCYNVTYALGALVPILANFIYKKTLNFNYISLLFVFLSSIAMISSLMIKDRVRQDLT